MLPSKVFSMLPSKVFSMLPSKVSNTASSTESSQVSGRVPNNDVLSRLHQHRLSSSSHPNSSSIISSRECRNHLHSPSPSPFSTPLSVAESPGTKGDRGSCYPKWADWGEVDGHSDISALTTVTASSWDEKSTHCVQKDMYF